MEVEKRAASSAWSLNHRHAVIFCILASPCMIAVGTNQISTWKKRQARSLCHLFSTGCYDFGACQLRGIGCSILMRLPSVSVNETYCPTPGISIGSPSTFPPASVTLLTASLISSTAITMDGCCAGQSGFFGKKPPLIAPDVLGPFSSVSVVVATT